MTRIRTAVRKTVAVLAMTAAVATGAAVTAATPAAAAGGNANDVTACFTYSNGTAYGSKGAYLLRWKDGAWTYTGRSVTTGPGGCARFNDVAGQYYYAVQAYWEYSFGPTRYYYNGFSSYVWSGAAQDLTLSAGRGTVGGAYCITGC